MMWSLLLSILLYKTITVQYFTVDGTEILGSNYWPEYEKIPELLPESENDSKLLYPRTGTDISKLQPSAFDDPDSIVR